MATAAPNHCARQRACTSYALFSHFLTMATAAPNHCNDACWALRLGQHMLCQGSEHIGNGWVLIVLSVGALPGALPLWLLRQALLSLLSPLCDVALRRLAWLSLLGKGIAVELEMISAFRDFCTPGLPSRGCGSVPLHALSCPSARWPYFL